MKRILLLAFSLSAYAASLTHSVTLTWAQADTTSVASFNVKRGTSSGGPYDTVFKVAGTERSYTDTSSLVSGATYYYVVTAVGGTCVDNNGVQYACESGPSPEAKAVIPRKHRRQARPTSLKVKVN